MPGPEARSGAPVSILVVGALLLATIPFAIHQGAAAIDWGAVLHGQDAVGSGIVLGQRLPRVLLSILVGGALAAAGTLMQAMTRNPLAGPSLMGLGPGAALAMLLSLVWLDPGPLLQVAVAFAGAALGAGLVFGVAALDPRGATPHRLVLAGAVVGAMLTAITSIIVIRLNLAEVLLFWTTGGLGLTTWPQVAAVLPPIAFGLLLAWAVARPLSILSAGEEAARSLGLRVGQVRGAAILAVLLLAGGAVAAAGPIGFVGIIVPHACRRWTGPDLRRLMPVAILAGAWLILAADMISRRCVGQFLDLPVGVVTAAIGAPMMLLIARRGLRRTP